MNDETKIFSNGLLPPEDLEKPAMKSETEPDQPPFDIPADAPAEPLKPEEEMLEKHLEDTLSLHLQEILAAEDAANLSESETEMEPSNAEEFPDTADADTAADKPALLPGIPADKARVRDWYFTFMCMNLPIIGWIYLLVLAFKKKKQNRREFARAYLLFKLTFSIVALALIALAIYIGLEYLDMLLAYMEML